VVLQLATQLLLSIGQLCDARCEVVLTATTVTICHSNNVIMSGHRTAATKLWNLDIQPSPPQASANVAIGTAKPAKLVAFVHAAMFSPAFSTLAEALWHGYLPEFAGLTLECLQQHPPKSIAMMKGHLDQDWKNLQSTQAATPRPASPEDEAFPAMQTTAVSTHAYYVTLMEPTRQMYMYLTGKFMAPSSSNNYIMILYDYDSNAILAIPLKIAKQNQS